MAANADQIAYWNDVAGPRWVRDQAQLERLLAPMTEELLAAAKLERGEHVLEIGCGCGSLAMMSAEAVGPSGKVCAVDVSSPMLSYARQRAQAHGSLSDAIEFREGDAAVQKFEASFDVLISHFGSMFFDDRLNAFRNLHSALKPGGRFLLLAWCARRDVEWMSAPLHWIAEVVPPSPHSDGEIGPFAFADPVATSAMLELAGFRHVVARRIERALPTGATIEEGSALIMSTGPAAAALREASPATLSAAEVAIRAQLMERMGESGVELGGAAWLFSGSA